MMHLEHIYKICNELDIKIDDFIRLYICYEEEKDEEGFSTYNERPVIMAYQILPFITSEEEEQRLENLQKKGLISGHSASFDTAVVSDKFIESVFVNSTRGIDELFQVYPDFISIEKGVFPLKAVPREDINYMSIINNDILLHNEIISSIQKTKELEKQTGEHYLNMKIDKFVKSKYWETLWSLLKDYNTEDESENYGSKEV